MTVFNSRAFEATFTSTRFTEGNIYTNIGSICEWCCSRNVCSWMNCICINQKQQKKEIKSDRVSFGNQKHNHVQNLIWYHPKPHFFNHASRSIMMYMYNSQKSRENYFNFYQPKYIYVDDNWNWYIGSCSRPQSFRVKALASLYLPEHVILYFIRKLYYV